MLTVGVLGPLRVAVDGKPITLSSSRQRVLLVVLAMAAGSPLPVDRLAAALWDDELPDHVRRVVQTYLGRLRAVIGERYIVTEPGGYRLLVEPEQVDALRFAGLLEAASRAPDEASERARLDEALALWRGNPFDGVQSDWLTRYESPRLIERQLAAVERLIDLDLASGRHREQVARLRELTARHPLRESLWVRLLTALDRSGRQAEALAGYETIRRRLVTELGTDPGQQLRRLYADLLAGDQPRPEPPDPVDPLDPVPPPLVVPRQLPADIDGFTGRTAALDALHAYAAGRDARSPHAMVISAIAGTAGVGKTALAVHWAHQIADRFPDGQLYVNLRGFHPSGQAVAPAEAIRGFLAALEVPAARTPSDPDALVGLYRSQLAGKQMLVVLDNARDSDQVRPLLPGSPTCLVVVTSRNQLTGLIAAESAQPLVLSLLPVEEARHLLARRLGAERVAAEPAATDEIIDRCARLPLALAIAAALAATRPTFPLATVAAQLRDEESRLDALTSDDPAGDTRAVFSWSYRSLSPAAARLFRLLGLHPGPDFSAPAAASLAALPAGQTRTLLAELCRCHLLIEHTPGRYGFHDLLRAYATELAHEHDSAPERQATVDRLLDHYLHSSYAATTLLNPHREPVPIPPPRAGVAPEELAGEAQALAWRATEHAVLVAAIRHAAAAGLDTHTWPLAWTILDLLYRRGAWDEWRETQHAALVAATRLADPLGQAVSHRGVAMAYSHLGQFEEAAHHFQQALMLYERLGDPLGEAHIQLHLAAQLSRQDRYAEALPHCQRALDRYAAAGSRLAEARALNTLGFIHTQLGDQPRALASCQRAAELFQELADPNGWATALDNLGFAHFQLGEHLAAIDCYQDALALYEKLDSAYFQAETLAHLGDAQLAAGEPAAARAAWRQALELFDESARSRADEVRSRLAALP